MRIRTPLFVALPFACAFAACAKAPSDTVEAIGTLEVVEVDVSPISPGRVLRVLVDEGAAVRTGDTLAILTTPTISSDVAQREAKEASTSAALQEAERGPRTEEIASATAELASADAAADRAAKDVDRLRPLAAKQNVSAQDFDAARATAASAVGHRDALRAQLQQLREGTRPERLRAAEADERGARASVASARATAGDLVLLSPVTGTVLARSTEPGEIVAAGQAALTVAQTARQTVHVYVGETVLPRLKVGQHVHAALDAYPGHAFDGRVTAISTVAEYTPRVALTEKERNDLLFGVKVEFADTTGMLKAGLPITVRIDAPAPTGKP
jgi:HlyD family secretion protein